MPKVIHYTITLPAHITAKLQAENEESKTPKSTLIAQHLEEYYNTAPAAQYEAKIQEIRAEIQRVKDEQSVASSRGATAEQLALLRGYDRKMVLGF
jgi:hypothetical protein